MPASQEWSSKCQQLILDHAGWCESAKKESAPFPCVFGDIEGCVPPGHYEPEDPFVVKTYKLEQAPLLTHQFCKTHQRNCALLGPSAESQWGTAGLPCPDQSRAGLRRYEEGPTAPVFICHAKRHVEKRTPMILLENVQDRLTNIRSLPHQAPVHVCLV